MGSIRAGFAKKQEMYNALKRFKDSGKKIIVLLSKFLVLDLEKNLSTQSSCAQTLFVKVPILLVRNNNDHQTPEIDIFANRSHANYIYNLLVDGTKNLDF